MDLLKRVDLLHMNTSTAADDGRDNQRFFHTYDDYFS